MISFDKLYDSGIYPFRLANWFWNFHYLEAAESIKLKKQILLFCKHRWLFPKLNKKPFVWLSVLTLLRTSPLFFLEWLHKSGRNLVAGESDTENTFPWNINEKKKVFLQAYRSKVHFCFHIRLYRCGEKTVLQGDSWQMELKDKYRGEM